MATRAPASEFLPTLHRHSGVSLERQLVQGFRGAILNGVLTHGTRLPSSRDLAARLGLNRNTVTAALEQLHAEGCLETRRGSGTYVLSHAHGGASPVRALSAARWLREVPPPRINPASPGQLEPSAAAFPVADWNRALRTALRGATFVDYGAASGEPVLREAIAAYLRRARGFAVQAEDVLVTSGAIQAINLVAEATRSPEARVAFEDPGYPLARQVFERHGASLLPLEVDEHGLRVEALPTGRAAPGVVYVTPSHQFPIGGRLPLTRRQELLEWAHDNDALIVEDDYDSEFRYDVPPLPPLASLEHAGRVAYIGTFSKVLSPRLRLGYVIATPALQVQLERLKLLSDYHSESLTQLALAQFIEDGALERHIARMRRVYAERRAALIAALAPAAPLALPRGLEAGLNIFLECDPGLNLERIVAACARQGVRLSTSAHYSLAQTRWHGLVLEYGGLELEEIERVGRHLVDLIRPNSSAMSGSSPEN